MNRHKYKKLQKRTKFLRKRVLEGRGKKKQVGLFFHIYQTISFFSHYDVLKFGNDKKMQSLFYSFQFIIVCLMCTSYSFPKLDEYKTASFVSLSYTETLWGGPEEDLDASWTEEGSRGMEHT